LHTFVLLPKAFNLHSVAKRQQVAWKLREAKQSAPLWNGKAFAQPMEAAYTAMYQKSLDQRVIPI
jgi:predicted O-linked N-acetylglucosamine transferase (SPINDLY family)